MDGIHLLGEWYECPGHTPEFTRAEALRATCLEAFARRGGFVRSLRCVIPKPQRAALRASFSEVQA